MVKLAITDFEITTTVGDNRQPAGGTVTFSDGKWYDWNLAVEHIDGKYQHTNGIVLYGRRKRLVHNEYLRVNSAKRELLVQEYLKRDDLPPTRVFKVSFE